MGGHKSSTKTVVEKQEQHSWVMDIPGLQQAGKNAVSENGSIPLFTYIPYNSQQLQALNEMNAGQSQQVFEEGAQGFTDYAKTMLGNGGQYASKGMEIVSRIGGMGANDYNDLINSYMNSELVKKQEAQSTKDLTEQYNNQVQALNQSAVMSGNMGSSRAGVAQGVMFGKTQDAIARANLGIEQSAYQNALGMAQFQVGQQSNMAGQMIQYGQNAQAQGLQAANTGLNWYQQIRQNNIADTNNRWTAGSLLQQQQQQQAEIQRQNDYITQNKALLHWQSLTGAFAPAASWSSTGQNTTTTKMSGGGGGIMGGIMGAVGAGVGGYFGGPMGAQVGAGVGGQLGNAM